MHVRNCAECSEEYTIKRASDKKLYCSDECRYTAYGKKRRGNGNGYATANCGFCNILIKRKGLLRSIKNSKSGKVFCSLSCKQKFQVTFQPVYLNRSRCEQLLTELLREYFPNLDILNNDRLILDGLELDIYIPQLRLGIEWNGEVHRKPIYGHERFLQIQKNDILKTNRASEKGIDLIIVDDPKSRLAFVHERFHEIKTLIESRLQKQSH